MGMEGTPEALESPEKFIEDLELDIKEGQSALTIYGKNLSKFELPSGKHYQPTSEWQGIEYAGTKDTTENLAEKISRSEHRNPIMKGDLSDILKSEQSKNNPVDEVVLVATLTERRQEGTRDEVYEAEEKGFFGNKKVKKVRQVPNLVEGPMLLSDITREGAEEPAYILSVISIAETPDTAGRSYHDHFQFILTKSQVERIVGKSTAPGGLLKLKPGMLHELIKRIAPEILASHEGKKPKSERTMLVVADDFSENRVSGLSASEILSGIKSGKLNDNLLRYSLEK